MTRKLPINEYDILEQVGNGSFGSVHRAKNRATGDIVAVKVMKKQTSSDGSHLREYKLMKQLGRHPNIVQFYDSFVNPKKDHCFVMEYMSGGNLCQLINNCREAKQLMELDQARNIIRQILVALAHLHGHGIFHRDLKPENILLRNTTPIEIKLGDFGHARYLKSRPPYTEYVSTRWYRAPEVLLHSTSYSYPVDLWAVGAICAEVVTLRPLFPGQSEIDQLYRICELLGSPSSSRSSATKGKRIAGNLAASVPTTNPISAACEWPEGVVLANKLGFEFPQLPPKPLSTAISNADELLLDMIAQFLYLNPSKRLNANSALVHPFLRNGEHIGIESPPISLLQLQPSTSVAQDLKVAFLGSMGKKKEKPSHILQAVKNGDPHQSHKSKGISTLGLELPSIPLSPFAISPDWSFGKTNSARRHSVIRSGISQATLDNIDFESPSATINVKDRVPRPLPLLPRPSHSTPLLSDGAPPISRTSPSATKSSSAFSSLFGIRNQKKHRREQQQQQKDNTGLVDFTLHSIPRTESSPTSLFKSSTASHQTHRRSLSMMMISTARSAPAVPDIPVHKKKTNRLSFWSKKHVDGTLLSERKQHCK